MVNGVVDAASRKRVSLIAWYWLPVLTYAGLIFYLSSLPNPEELAPTLFQVAGDKVLHGIEYGILGVLCYRAFRYAAGSWAAGAALGLAILSAAGYGLSDEIHQAFVPSRESGVSDVLADAVGAAVATWFWRWKVE